MARQALSATAVNLLAEVATDAEANFVELYAATTTVTAAAKTANYTLALADAGTVVEMNMGAANNLTVPTNATVAFPIGSVVEVCQIGTGQTTVVAASGVQVRSSATLALRAQWSTATLRKRDTDEWVMAGDAA